jgi:hypothetical protein
MPPIHWVIEMKPSRHEGEPASLKFQIAYDLIDMGEIWHESVHRELGYRNEYLFAAAHRLGYL